MVPALKAMLKSVATPLERRLLFEPSAYPDGDWRPAGLEFVDAHFAADDGVRLHGWYCRCPNPRAVVLWCHGNAGNLSYRAGSIRRWQQELSVDVFVFDYRGYGRSEGTPTEDGLYRDARAAYEWLRGHRDTSPQRIILLGRSLGGAVAAQLAFDKLHHGLILQSTFTSVPDMTRHMFGVPLGWFVRNRFETINKLAAYDAPLLITHGTRDEMIPFGMGQRLFVSARGQKTFYPIHGAGHTDFDSVGGREYFQTLERFIETSMAAAQSPSHADAPASAAPDGEPAPVGGFAFDI